ncbi:MAG: hypothetical protein JKY52_19315 [Flavobacteriales bacterium]|nr:hypothetical protein [Flavobacteriales bacterium]
MKLDEDVKEASIIALAWPRTRVRRIGVWYDRITRWLGFIKGDYYHAGHAAAVLVNHSNGALRYFDFGRYHTPEKLGRLRGDNTDPELKLLTTAKFYTDGEIENIEEVLKEIAAHPSTHGEGVMYASVARNIDLTKALKFTEDLQQAGMVHYGPFDLRGTNCSRFVRDVIRYNTRNIWVKIKLSLPWMLTPATKWSVVKAKSHGFYYKINGSISVQRSLSPIKKAERLILPQMKIKEISPEPFVVTERSSNT